MSNQVQCPNCGGYRTAASSSQYWTIDKIMQAKEPEKQRKTALILWLLFPLVGAIDTIIVGGILAIVILPIANYFKTGILLPLVILVFASTVLGIAWAIHGIRNDILRINKPEEVSVRRQAGRPGKDYSCELCNYQWHLDPGQPNPPTRGNTALMAAGEERLRVQSEMEQLRKQKEEQEATAEHQRLLEANHWNYWHNPDNPWNNPDNTSNQK